jgi:TorA maturation chaperone TorD
LLTSVVAASQTVFYRQLAQLAQIYLRLIAEQFVDQTYTPPRTTIADVVVKR